ncbi:cytochrome-c oxidase, cbb3-type subunit III [Mesorhizobium sp. M00.F.Ca.ET.216.01.1.1]|uniref:cytochrome-c oxidase, cbb3-type subunit III n=1 Tax=Mesorhizobium sp. M00.F.Ca.ET.216.01.1.1 TaxID=2500528 RepID=UPI000FD82DFF|nr:cytochrome-c oxidase, cbb3-type subunit III [Mesorhizobium sp. M00.F.Ca.ET.216.01.1.1]TGQ30033.1 cytochrome-c oxidase, cbb3-type subunit III [Mesorhizobium sp. M00.F.Ca.ET.216.01.1.1]TJW07049.1 MAG: cytochrome-c oxidase, cbb3-type subunit III [Mesorhizobium sp.]
MAVEELDPVSGRTTTGHEWNGIKELDTPIPRGVLMFLIVTHLFAVIWWFVMPTWPLGTTYTKGLLDTDQRKIVEEKLVAANAARAPWVDAIEKSSFDQILANPQLMEVVRETGHRLFGDNCAACHGRDGKGGKNYPDLTDHDWIWGGGPETIAATMRIGVNSSNPESRVSQMPSFGRGQMLDPVQVRNVAFYVHSLSNASDSTPDNVATIEAGRQVFLTTCAACHGEDAKGKMDMGAPNLTDQYWIYGGDLETIVTTVHGGRQGHMPTWDERLTPAEIKILALYVYQLGVENP